ncbi:MAG: Eco57I restriction-modification methylase domain-containing protein [Polyangiaceae bacterium]|jgi:adenine-specific DNA-methyltransferase
MSAAPSHDSTAAHRASEIEETRLDVSRRLDPATRSELGQYFTPRPVASFMARFFDRFPPTARLLDAGAGIGGLIAAAVVEAIERPSPPSRMDVVGYEMDSLLLPSLARTLAVCGYECKRRGVEFRGSAVGGDFIAAAVALVQGRVRGRTPLRFTHAILNPPYRKLGSNSTARLMLRRVGIETSNLYTGFVALALQLLDPGGELVAITPRSFCNGPYFRAFRQYLLRETALRRFHVFESRTAAFAGDEVLQENVIFHAIKGARPHRVVVSTSLGPEDPQPSMRAVPFEQVVRVGDPESFIRVICDQSGQRMADLHSTMPCVLTDLGVTVSTGKVVDFRVRPHLRRHQGSRTEPLIYPTHLVDGLVRWPKPGKKPNALADLPSTKALWMPSGTYVLIKRFTSKEERRRIVAAVFEPELVPAAKVGFENHLNVLHASGVGLDRELARGLAAFLNSTFVDLVFRQFSGHTQVNATDLRSLRFPTATTLRRLGGQVPVGCSQREIDDVVDAAVGMAGPLRSR